MSNDVPTNTPSFRTTFSKAIEKQITNLERIQSIGFTKWKKSNGRAICWFSFTNDDLKSITPMYGRSPITSVEGAKFIIKCHTFNAALEILTSLNKDTLSGKYDEILHHASKKHSDMLKNPHGQTNRLIKLNNHEKETKEHGSKRADDILSRNPDDVLSVEIAKLEDLFLKYEQLTKAMIMVNKWFGETGITKSMIKKSQENTKFYFDCLCDASVHI